MSRAARRALGGERRIKKMAKKDITKIIELDQAGYSIPVISRIVRLDKGFVADVLRRAAEVRKVEEGGG
jgi:hypothetical protein